MKEKERGIAQAKCQKMMMVAFIITVGEMV